MLVKELKDTIKNYNDEEKVKIIVELYKRIPKIKKEDYDIDNFIINIKDSKNKKNETEVLSFDNLEKQVNYFLQCVNMGLYASPNKIVSKSERSNWRHKVKKYYKDLNSFKPDTEDGIKATDLLQRLFKVLSVGTHVLRFSNWNTFNAIQVSQEDFLEIIVKRKLATGITRENIKYCCNLLDVEYDPYGWHKALFYSFVCCFKTADSKYIAIEVLNEMVIEMNEKLECLKKSKKSSYRDEFDLKKYNNYFTECIVYFYFNLCEADNAIKYYHKNYIESHQEIKEYILLEMLENEELYKEWIIEYEKHLDKIMYRDSLKEKYVELKEKV